MKRRNFGLLFGLALGSILLWLSLRHVEPLAVARALKAADLWLAVPFLLLLALFYWLKALRWSALLSPAVPLPAGKLVPSMMVGFAGNNLMPVRLGELLRIYLLSKEQSLSPSMVFATVVLERLFDAFALLLIVALAITFGPASSKEFTFAGYALLGAVAGAAILIYGIVVSPRWLSDLGKMSANVVPAAWRPALARQLASVRIGFASIRSGDLVFRTLLNSIVQWLLMVSCVYLAILAFGLTITPVAAIVVLALVVIGISLPNAPAFVGTIEYCFVAGLGLFGVPPTQALGIALFYHALSFAFVTLSGLYFFRRYGTSWKDLQNKAKQVRNAGS